ncbi:hypothetical protein, partial [Nonomuraea sp. NPDC049695]|uniref:hypothetical protein n=1 Tax=Nonomuraea sp. NPDC049695 TaxID=3154734 RepID=UPI003417CAE5
VTVLVVCPDRAVAAYYAQPIESGLPGYRLQARVLGPDGIPVITDPQHAAARPALAAMSVMAHGRNRKVIEAFATALSDTRNRHATKYTEYAYSMAAPDIRRLMEEIMTSTDWPVYTPWAREHYGRGLEEGQTKGKAEEAAKMLLLVLAARDFDVPDDMRARITACADVAQLEHWTSRAVTAQALQDLFSEPDAQRH